MVTAILFIVLGVGFLIYNNVLSEGGRQFTVLGTDLDFGWALLAIGVVNLVLQLRHRRRRQRPRAPRDP